MTASLQKEMDLLCSSLGKDSILGLVLKVEEK